MTETEVAEVPADHDADPRHTADDLDRQRPDWLALCGEYTHEFVAFPLFRTPSKTILTAHYPHTLVARMRQVVERGGANTGGRGGREGMRTWEAGQRFDLRGTWLLIRVGQLRISGDCSVHSVRSPKNHPGRAGDAW